MTNLPYVKRRVSAALNAAGGPGSTLTVVWQQPPSGVQPEPVFGAYVGPQTELSGTMRVLWHQANAQVKLRKFSEVQMGDALIDFDPQAPIQCFPSGVIQLDQIPDAGVVFVRGGQRWVQAEVGEALAQAMSVVVGDQEVLRTMLLRKAT